MQTKPVLLLFFFTLAAFFAAAGDGNHIFNGEFKLGNAGFELTRYLNPAANRELKFLPAAAGPEGLTIRNPYLDNWEFLGQDFTLEPETEYELSLRVKGARSGGKLRVSLRNLSPADHSYSSISFDFTPEEEFKVHRLTFKTGKDRLTRHLLFRSMTPATPFGDLSFSWIRLAKTGDAKPTPLEAAIMAPETLLERGDSPAPAELRLAAHAPSTGKLRLRFRDDYTGKLLMEREYSIHLAPGEVAALPLELPRSRYGRFQAELQTADFPLAAAEFGYSVIGRYTARPLDFGRDFCVSVNGGSDLYDYPLVKWSEKVRGYRCTEGGPEDFLKLLARIGIRMLRDHDAGYEAFNWGYLEPEPGKFDFRHLDQLLARYERHHIQLLPVLGRSHFAPRPWQSWPEWLPPLCRVQPAPGHHVKYNDQQMTLPPYDRWHDFIHAAALHAKGRIPYYEIINEPQLYMSAADYSGYLKSASEAIRKADPAAKVIGLCLTSDFGGNMDQFCRESMALGSGKWLDAIGFHPYGPRTLTSKRPADLYIRSLRQAVPDFPLWNTELYYLADPPPDEKLNAPGRGMQGFRPPHYAAWRFLLDLGEGCTQSSAVHVSALFAPFWPLAGGSHRRNVRLAGNVCVAYNALARIFEGARPAGSFKRANGVVCYRYEKDGRPLAAIWNYLDNKEIAADFSNLEVLDLYGNPVPAAERAVRPAPAYLLPGKLSNAEFDAAMKKLESAWLDPVELPAFARVLRNRKRLLFHLANNRNESIKLDVNLRGESKTVPLRPKQRGTVETTSFREYIWGNRAEVVFTFDGRTEKKTLALYSTWWRTGGESYSAQRKDDDLKIDYRVSRRGDQLEIDVRVNDATDSGAKNGRDFWEQDCVELFFDTRPRELETEFYTRNVMRLFILPRWKEGQLQTWNLLPGLKRGDIDCRVENNPGGYRVTLHLPLAALKLEDGLLGLDICASDAADAASKRFRKTSVSEFYDQSSIRLRFPIFSLE